MMYIDTIREMHMKLVTTNKFLP